MIELADAPQAVVPAAPSLLDQLLDTLVQRVAAQVEGRVSQRITALETQLNTSTLTPLTHEYIAKVAREAVATTPALTEERVREIARDVADEAITDHADSYNHEEYDRVCDMLDQYDLDDFVSEDDLSRKVRGCVKDMTFTVSVEVD